MTTAATLRAALVAEHDELAAAATSQLAIPGGSTGLPGPRELLRQAAQLTGIIAEIDAITS